MSAFVLFGDSLAECCFALLHTIEKLQNQPLTALPKEFSHLNPEPIQQSNQQISPIVKLIVNKQYTAFLNATVITSLKTLLPKQFNSNQEEHMRNIFSLTYCVLSYVNDTDLHLITKQLIAILAAQPKQVSNFALHQLVTLFNLVTPQTEDRSTVRLRVDRDTKYTLLVTLLNYARKTEQSNELSVSTLKQILTLASDWQIDLLQMIQLHQLVYQIAEDQNDHKSSKILLYETLKTASLLDKNTEYKTVVNSLRSLVIDAVVATLKHPLKMDTLSPQRLLMLRIVRDSLAEEKNLLMVLKLFTSHSALKDWDVVDKTVLAKYGVDENALVAALRTLALCQLGSKEKVLTYEAIRQRLNLHSDDVDEEVENIVIDAVQSGMCDAKLDQSKHVVLIKRVVSNLIELSSDGNNVEVDWQTMATKLSQWKNELIKIQQVMKNHQQFQMEPHAQAE